MSAQKSVPLRTCIACREEKPKKEMLRIVKNAQGEIRVDFTGKLSGRGAYICNRDTCFTKLNKAKLLHKAFHMDVPEEVYGQIAEEFFGKK